MTPDEAIKIKLQWRKDNFPPALVDELNADMMSIEALKFRLRWEQQEGEDNFPLLPGETKEEKPKRRGIMNSPHTLEKGD